VDPLTPAGPASSSVGAESAGQDRRRPRWAAVFPSRWAPHSSIDARRLCSHRQNLRQRQTDLDAGSTENRNRIKGKPEGDQHGGTAVRSREVESFEGCESCRPTGDEAPAPQKTSALHRCCGSGSRVSTLSPGAATVRERAPVSPSLLMTRSKTLWERRQRRAPPWEAPPPELWPPPKLRGALLPPELCPPPL
jgi:hypothetical protein